MAKNMYSPPISTFFWCDFSCEICGVLTITTAAGWNLCPQDLVGSFLMT